MSFNYYLHIVIDLRSQPNLHYPTTARQVQRRQINLHFKSFTNSKAQFTSVLHHVKFKIIKMLVVKLFAIIFFTELVCGFVSIPQNHQDEEISAIVRRLIEEFNSKEPQTSDVVLLKSLVDEKHRQRLEDISQSVVKAIPEENIVTTPQVNKVIRNERTRKATWIIIISDSKDVVSQKFSFVTMTII